MVEFHIVYGRAHVLQMWPIWWNGWPFCWKCLMYKMCKKLQHKPHRKECQLTILLDFNDLFFLLGLGEKSCGFETTHHKVTCIAHTSVASTNNILLCVHTYLLKVLFPISHHRRRMRDGRVGRGCKGELIQEFVNEHPNGQEGIK